MRIESLTLSGDVYSSSLLFYLRTVVSFWQRFKRDRESTARKATVGFLMFTSNYTYLLTTISKLNVSLECFFLFRCPSDKQL